jgi:myo-inositol 2-dehydrogenase/D-chiro-inositol 1-dehydrogenase
MNVLILGSGEEELAWARWLTGRAEHRLDAALPGFSDPALARVPAPRDLEDALARPRIDLVIVGGPLESRAEYLRRAAAEGFALICLHPPALDSEAYYQVALSRHETGAVIVPDLRLRLHPGVRTLAQVLAESELGEFRALRMETASGSSLDLARVVFARSVDVIRALLGEIEALTATGDPPGTSPELDLIVQLRSAGAQRAEVRAWAGPAEPIRLSLVASGGVVTLECDPAFQQTARLIRHTSGQADQTLELEPWDSHAALLGVLLASLGRRSDADLPSPNLLDGTRAMELAEATVRSLRRGRTIDLHYEAITEEATFKSIMTSTGCLIFIASLLALPLAMAGPPLGMRWTLFIPYVIPPILVIFVVMQTLRPGTRSQTRSGRSPVDDAPP